MKTKTTLKTNFLNFKKKKQPFISFLLMFAVVFSSGFSGVLTDYFNRENSLLNLKIQEARAADNTSDVIIGKGCTTAYYIDHDCDGYGVASPKGPDADDNDASVNTAQSVIEKYGTLQNFFSTVKGYNPLHYYYVDVENGDDSTGAIDDESKPYKTWDGVHHIVKAGDIIIYRAGIHNVPITFIYPSISGTEENPIIVMAYPGELAIIDRLAAGISVMRSNNLIFDGLTCRNTENNLGRGVAVTESRNVTLVNIDSGHSTSGLFAMRILHNFHVENCVFHDTYPAGTHCVYLGGMYEANRDIIFRGNLMYNCGMNAFQYNGAATNMLFENNILHSSNMAAISLLMGVSDSVFRNNLGFNNSHGVIIYNYITPLGPPSDQKNNLFINNTFWTGKYNHGTGTVGPEGAASVHFNDYILDPETREPQLELIRSFDNNVFRNNILVTSAGPTMRFDQEDYLDTTVFENNLVYRYGDYRYDGAEYALNYGGGYYDNYDFDYFENFSELIKNNKYSWSEFKDVSIDYATTPEKFNFDHSYNSPAIDFGISADAPSYDIKGNLRDAHPDAGCYEYTGVRVYECSDGIDNDGDGQIDYPNDAGCSSDEDDDESNCGDLVCESGENCQTCSQDCLTGAEEVCCSGILYSGDCCLDNDCSSPDTCQDNVCSKPIPVYGICEGLNLSMHFDNDFSTIQDFSEKENNGTVHGATFTSSGKFAGAFDYDGDGDYIEIPNNESLQFNGKSFSVGAWVKLNSDSGPTQTIVSKDNLNYGNKFPWVIYAYDSNYYFSVPNINGASSLVSAVDTSKYSYVVGTFDPNGYMKIYVDGIEKGSIDISEHTFSSLSGNDPVRIGMLSYATVQSMNGAIDEVAIWNRSLSAEKILEMFNSGGKIECEEEGIDTAPPTASILISDGETHTNTQNITLNISATDSSGVTEMKISNTNDFNTTAEEYKTTKSLTLTANDGDKIVYAWFKDAVGNWTEEDSPVTDTIILDTTAPVKINNLASSNITQTALDILWTSSGDDGNTDTAKTYDLRYSTSNITSGNWNNATQATGEPTPQIAGSNETYTAIGLTSETKYYFAIKTIDEAGNISELSNIAEGTTKTSILAKYKLHLKLRNELGEIITNAKVKIYSDNKDDLEGILDDFNFDNDTPVKKFKEIEIQEGLKRHIRYLLPQGQKLTIKEFALNKNITLNPQFINNYTGILPNQMQSRSSIIALDDAELSYDNAEITLSTTGEITHILHCTEWNFETATCAENHWEIKPLKDYSYTIDSENNLITLTNITNFDAYLAVYGETPNNIADLSASDQTTSSIKLSWTVPENQENAIASYDFRYSTSNITDDNWDSITQIENEPAPTIAGTTQTITVDNLSSGLTYYFAAKTTDSESQTSELSNIASETTTSPSSGSSSGGYVSDTTPPAQPKNFEAVLENDQINLTWENPTDSDFVRVKILRRCCSASTSHNDSTAEVIYEGTEEEYADTNLENNTTYHYSIFAYDKKPNYSEILTIQARSESVEEIYPEGTLIKIPESFRIYVMINNKKKWISTPEVFETLGYQWGNITLITKGELNLIPDYEDNLIREINGYKVYLVTNGFRRHIPNPEIFLDYGFLWEDVKDVSQETINQYQRGYLIRESKQERIYYLREDGIKKHIPSPEIFSSYDNKWEDIQVISQKEMNAYHESNLIQLQGENGIYLLENNMK